MGKFKVKRDIKNSQYDIYHDDELVLSVYSGNFHQETMALFIADMLNVSKLAESLFYDDEEDDDL